MSIHTRIRERRQKLGYTYEGVAKEMTALMGEPTSWQSVQQWERDVTPRHKRLEALAKVLQTSAKQLMFGDEPPEPGVKIAANAAEATIGGFPESPHTRENGASQEEAEAPGLGSHRRRVTPMARANTLLLKEVGSAVPKISWVRAGNPSPAADPYSSGDAEEWLTCPVKHGPRTIALEVRGESMLNRGQKPSYEHGDIIFVDPDREAVPGDRVVVRLEDDDEATFKQLVVEDGRKLLKALNPEWHPRYIEINGHATIVGVVIGKWVPE